MALSGASRRKQIPSSNAPWAIFVFITDGAIEDLEAVKIYSLQLGKEIASGKRLFVKLVLIGIGAEADEAQMDALDQTDLWGHRTAATMQTVEGIVAEVVTADTILAPSATITDALSAPVTPLGRKSYADGLPALLEFTMPKTSKSFTLCLPSGKQVVQHIP